MTTENDTQSRPGLSEALNAVDRELNPRTSPPPAPKTPAQKAFENRIRAIASNAVLEALACYQQTRVTDDDAAAIDMIEKILLRPRGKITGYATLVPLDQAAHPEATTRLQLTVEAGLGAGAAATQP